MSLVKFEEFSTVGLCSVVGEEKGSHGLAPLPAAGSLDSTVPFRRIEATEYICDYCIPEAGLSIGSICKFGRTLLDTVVKRV